MELISHLLNQHSLSFLIQVAFPNLALVSMVQGSGTGTTTTGLSKALQQSLQAMNGMRLPWWHWCSPLKRCLVCLVLQYIGTAAQVLLQLAEPDPSTQSSPSIPFQASFLRLSHTHTQLHNRLYRTNPFLPSWIGSASCSPRISYRSSKINRHGVYPFIILYPARWLEGYNWYKLTKDLAEWWCSHCAGLRPSHLRSSQCWDPAWCLSWLGRGLFSWVGGRMQHGGDGGDSEVIQFGSEICLQICSAANCICSDHATPKGSYTVLLVPCFTNLEVFWFVPSSDME